MKRESKRRVQPRSSSRNRNSTAAAENSAAPASSFAGAGFRDLVAASLLLLVTIIAYAPSLSGGLLWDDDGHLTKPELQSWHGLWRIWFDLGATQQYYPLLHSAFWVEHRLWGDWLFGYHLSNVLLHATAACLVVWIAKRLSLPGAWLAGYIFALHPVCVEAVAWISEQKSTLSTVFYLGAAITYLHFDRTRSRYHYLLASGLFFLALLSKTVTATLPAALLVVLWWQRGRIGWKRDALPLAPWFALGATAGLLTAWVERRYIGAQGAHFTLTLGERCLLAGRVIWFYMDKLLWPVNLMFTYPHWTVDPRVWWQYLFPIGVLVFAAGLVLLRRRSRGPLAGFLVFVGTLFPALGFFNVFPFVYSYVADHFQYLASLGILVPLACGLTLACKRIPAHAGRFGPAMACVLLAALGTLTRSQSAMYRDAETLYRETVRRNPASWMAHNNLGTVLAAAPGKLQEAIGEWETALRLNPDNWRAENNLGEALLTVPGRTADAIPHLEAALRLNPNLAVTHYNLAVALSRTGRGSEAIPEYESALRLQPDYADAHRNLGNLLYRMGRVSEATEHWEKVQRLRRTEHVPMQPAQ